MPWSYSKHPITWTLEAACTRKTKSEEQQYKKLLRSDKEDIQLPQRQHFGVQTPNVAGI